jgi:ribosome-binding ATPase YchF (GTP1/OBG family)
MVYMPIRASVIPCHVIGKSTLYPCAHECEVRANKAPPFATIEEGPDSIPKGLPDSRAIKLQLNLSSLSQLQ